MKRLLQRLKTSGYRKGLAKRIMAFVAAFVFFVTGLDANAFASAPSGTDMSGKNAYVFEVVTGIHAGTSIQWLEIVYVGTDNNTYRQLFFPNQDSQYLGRLQVEKVATDNVKAKDIASMYGYKGKTDRLSTTESSLGQYTMAQYYFTTDVAIKSVKYFDGFTGEGNKEWTCQGMRLFKVDKLMGLRMAGEWSNTWYIDFEGKLIADLPIDTIKRYNWSTLEPGYFEIQRVGVRQGDALKDKDFVNHASQLQDHNFGFRFDFADKNGSGFECLVNDYDCNKATLNMMNTVENFTLNITYTDIYGETRFLYLPGATSAAYWAYSNLSGEDRKKPVLGIAQQSGSLVFTGTIPDCKKIEDVSVAVGTEKAESLSDISYSSSNINFGRWTNSFGVISTRNTNKKTEENLRNRRSEASKTDNASLLCSAIYDMKSSTIKPSVNKAMLEYTITGEPIYGQVAASVEGKNLLAGSVNSIGFVENKKLTLPVDSNQYFVCQFTTENALDYAEVSGFSIKFNYINKRGEKTSTKDIKVKDAVLDYYGYWPGSTNRSDFAYSWTTGSGKTTRFLVGIRDVKSFTGAVISAPVGVNEDYQFKDFSMYSLTAKYPVRTVEWTDKKTEGNKSTFINIYRDLESDAIKIANISDTTLIQNGDEVSLDFTTSKITAVKDEGFDFTKYAITYSDAIKNHGFTKNRKTYEVEVEVYDDAVTTDKNGNVVSTGGNGDAGSENKFFFQLQFEYGSSGYVLGNQSLKEGDKFVSGRTHSFTVRMNEDYGNVIGINIISDEIGENAKPEDKLRINDIRVTEGSAAGTHICWVASNVGWIGSDYSDERNKYGGKGKAGKSAAELARTVNIDYTTNMVQLEFELSTGSYQVEDYSAKDLETLGMKNSDKASTKPRPQLQGTIKAKLTYYQTDGSLKDKEFDLVEAIYNYRNKTAPKGSGGYTPSDVSSMFRANHTDRFLVNIADVSSLSHLEMSVDAVDYPVTWAVTGLTARIVKDAGKLSINQFSEYQYNRDEVDENPVYMDKDRYNFIIGGSTQPCNVYFGENRIKIDPELRTATSVITRVPDSVNDTMNIFIFPSQDGNNDGIGLYDLSVKAYYNHLYSGVHQAGDGKMKKFVGEDGTEMFYSLGLQATCMSDLNQLIVEADSERGNQARLDYAIVQQIRSGVVVNTYYVDMNDDNAFFTLYKAPSNDLSELGYSEKQKVYIQVADNNQKRGLVPEKQDIAFAITYKLPVDATNTEYTSPYVYATDELIKRLWGGQVIGLEYSQMFVGEITGIKVVTTGTMEADLSCACAANYHINTDDELELQGYYNFANGVTASNQTTKMAVTSTGVDNEESIRHVSIAFTTSQPQSVYESGTNTPVKFTLYTTNKYDQVNDPPLEIADIRKYISDASDNFTTGETKTVELLVKGAAGLRRIIIEPQSENLDGSAGWSLENVVAQLDEETPISRTVEERVFEGRPKTILLSDLSISADVYNYNYTRNDDVYDMVTIKQGDEPLKLMMKQDHPLQITPTSNGSEYGCRVYATEINADGYESGAIDGAVTHNEGSKVFRFKAPKSFVEKKYRVYIESVEVPSVFMYLDVTVEARPEIKVSASVLVYNAEEDKYDITTADQETEVTVEAHIGETNPICIAPSLTNAEEGCDVYVKEIMADGTVSGNIAGVIRGTDSFYTFEAPSGSIGKRYKVFVESKENPDSKMSIIVNVTEAPKVETDDSNSDSNGNVSGDSTSNDSTVSGNSASDANGGSDSSNTNTDSGSNLPAASEGENAQNNGQGESQSDTPATGEIMF